MKRTSSKSKKTLIKSSFICNNIITRQNKVIENTCKKIESKLKKKKFRKKLYIGAFIFLLFNLAIILMLTRKTLVYKLTKYFAKRILDGATPQDKEMVNNIQTHLPMVVDFVTKHSDKIKSLDNNITYYSNMYNDFVNVIANPPQNVNATLPGSFPSSIDDKIVVEKNDDLQDKKLNEKQAQKLIDNLIDKEFDFDEWF